MIIHDVSDKGFSLVCTKEFPQGEIFPLLLLPADDNIIECAAEIRHSNNMGTGAKIISMDEKNRRAYDHYIQAMYSQHVGRLG